MLLRVISRFFLPPPLPRVSSLYTELFSFSLPPKTSLPHESRTCSVIFAHMHAQYKIPASIYIHFRSRTTRFLPRALSLRSFFSFFLLSTPCSSIHLACFQLNRLIFLLRFSLSRAQTFDTVPWNELCPYHILYIVIRVHTEHRKIPIAIYVTRHRYIYTNAISIFI